MSEENVELVRSMYERINESGDWRVGLDYLDPAVEFEISWRSGREASDFRVLHGIAEVSAAVEEMFVPFESVRYDVHELHDAGPDVVVILELVVRPENSDAEISTGRFGYVLTVRGDKLTRVQDFPEPADALKASGLLE